MFSFNHVCTEFANVTRMKDYKQTKVIKKSLINTHA